MGAQRMKFLQKDWLFWARDEQLPPDEWGKNGCFIWNIRCGRGWGKALSIDTPIPTPEGWTTMGALNIGDTIFDECGNPCSVSFVTEIMYNHKCYNVVFSDGSTITADEDHQWLTQSREERKAGSNGSVRTTKDIFKTLTIGKRKERNHSIQCNEGLKCEDANLPINPYVLGVWLGDGNSSGAVLACDFKDYQIVEEFVKIGIPIKKVNQADKSKTDLYSFGQAQQKRDTIGRILQNDSIHSKLKNMCLLNNKHIPKEYLRASYSQRLELLQGLMDTDGSVDINGRCEFVGINKKLVSDVYELIVSLGLKATVDVGFAKLNGKIISEKYRVRFTPYIPVFKLKRKLERLHKEGSQACRQGRRYITDIIEVESVPVRCIQVDSPNSLFLAGESMIPTHNTKTGAETFIWAVRYGGYKHPNLAGATSEDVRDLMIEGESGILNCCSEDFFPEFVPTLKKLTWPNGVVTHIYYGTEPDKARGPQSDFLWADELAKWQYPEETLDNLLMGLRLGPDPRCILTSTPRPTKFLMDLEKRKDLEGRPVCVTTRGGTKDNYANLSPVFLTTIIAKYDGTRLGKQELEGEFLDDNPDALWKRSEIDNNRVDSPPEFVKVVVGVDPAAKSEKSSDDTGIIVAAKGFNGHGYILEDATCHVSPKEWATTAYTMYNKYKANWIVAETNQGGEMVKATIDSIAKGSYGYLPVHASRGKEIRAEPISSLYQQNKIHHVGTFRELEDEMTEWIPNEGMKSPNRVDALVWAVTALDIQPGNARLPSNASKGMSFNSMMEDDDFRGF